MDNYSKLVNKKYIHIQQVKGSDIIGIIFTFSFFSAWLILSKLSFYTSVFSKMGIKSSKSQPAPKIAVDLNTMFGIEYVLRLDVFPELNRDVYYIKV